MLPSLPVTTTCIALLAVTVNMEEVPAMIAAGLAVMPLVGSADLVLKLALAQPESSMSSEEQAITVKGILLNDRRVSDFDTVPSFLSLMGRCGPSVLYIQMSDHRAVTFHQFIPRHRASAKLPLCCGLD